MSLCEYCSGLDFPVVGYHKGPCDVHNQWNRHSPDIKSIKLSARGCDFCWKVISLFHALVLPFAGDARSRLDNDDTIVSVSLDRTTYSNDEALDSSIATVVRLSVIFSNLTQGVREESIGIYFQKAPRVSANVSSILDDSNFSTWPAFEPYTARSRPIVADLRLLDKWKRDCLVHHQDECGQTYVDLDLEEIRLVDVKRKCIVKCTTEVTWVALSYVWGRAPMPKLTAESSHTLHTPGCLTKDLLPATIYDALALTEVLQVAYLWVDSLCIIQDDDADKAKYIPKMASIYGHALLTIVDAAGEDAHHGLPGLRPGSRTHQPEIFNANGAEIVESLEPPAANFVTGHGKWPSRGWTFQESILSRRRLIFHAEQISWECNKCVWREDAFLESPNILPIFRTRLDIGIDREQLWRPNTTSFEQVYRALVAGFSLRHLTYESDALDAIDGVLTVLNRLNSETFLWGLPETYLGSALTWSTDVWITTLVRRKGTGKFRQSGKQPVDCTFPSWSWIGWVGAVELDSPLQYENAGLVFYRICSEDTVLPIKQLNVTRRFEAHLTSAGRDLPDYSWRNSGMTVISPSDVPKSVFTRQLGPAVLCFWTSTAILEVKHDEVDDCGVLLPQVASSPEVLEVEWRQKPQYCADRAIEHCEFAVISRHYLERPEYGFQLAIVMLSAGDDGLVYRRGLAIVFEKDWIALNHRRWKKLFLR